MNGQLVGRWAVDRGTHRFSYDKTWLDNPKRRALSLSLPITPTLEVTGEVVANYFDNLLPDNDKIRARLARRYKTKKQDVFTLLEAIGRDCVGAVQLLPEGEQPLGWDQIDGEPLNEAKVAEILRATPSEDVLGQRNNDALFRISLAGAQEKTALLCMRQKWYRPKSATPTTHILKLPLGIAGGIRRFDLADSVENEWLCARILHHMGLPVAESEILTFEDQKVLSVRRFDRSWQHHQDGRDWIARLPQEDFCQALGVPPTKKYEQDGGPGMAACLRLLEGSSDSGDRETFAVTQLAFWLLCATDGHAKNFSIFLEAGDSYITTPIYDVLSAFPYIGMKANQLHWREAEMAMALRSKNAHYHVHGIHARHWKALAETCGGNVVWNHMLRLVEGVDAILEDVSKELPAGFPEKTWGSISRGTKKQAATFRNGLKAQPTSPRP